MDIVIFQTILTKWSIIGMLIFHLLQDDYMWKQQ